MTILQDNLRTRAVEDMLKAVFALSRQHQAISLLSLAEETGLESGDVESIAHRLQESGLAQVTPEAVLQLTEAGQRLALELTLRTEAVEDFLKVTYLLQRQYDPVPTSALASELGIKPPSVTEMAKKLAENGLLEYEKYKGIRLTEPGRRIALEVVRHHRLLEMFLTQALGYSWDEVHEEADRLEHVISEQFESRIAAALGYPNHDPHGDPIPDLDGSVPIRQLVPLTDMPTHLPFIVCRITDQSAEALRYLEKLGLVLGAEVIVTAHDPFDGPIHIRVEAEDLVIGSKIARHVLLTEASMAEGGYKENA